MGYKKTKNFDEIRCDLTLIEINIICDVPFYFIDIMCE